MNAHHTLGTEPVSIAASSAAPTIKATPGTQTAALHTLDGRYIAAGVVEIDATAAPAWSATVRHLDRPGAIATLFFSEGIRDVMVRLQDGRRARARLTGTSFLASSERICRLEGRERLA